MNKKELTKKLMERMQNFGYFPSFTNVKVFIQEYEKMADPGPTRPVVPHFVAEWIEKVGGNLFGLNYDMVPEEIYDWVNEEKGNFKKLHLACAIGYEVEKEKRYLVKVKNVLTRQGALNRNKKSGRFIFSNPEENSLYDTKFTREELEGAGFGWVFDCPGIEVEEVQDDTKI